MTGVEEVSELRHRGGDDTTDTPRSDTPHYPTLVVMEMAPKVVEKTVDWLRSIICMSKSKGGAALVVRKCHDRNKKTWTLHLSASSERLLLGAEVMELKKPCTDGSLREFTREHKHLFIGSDDPDSLLTMCEKQRIIQHDVEIIRVLDDGLSIPGLKSTFYEGEAIVPRLMEDGKITQFYPLHDKDYLKQLSTTWYKTLLDKQPIEMIQAYFGDTLAMYFSFLGFYTVALVPPALVGILSKFLMDDLDLVIFFSLFNLVWTTIFLESWKRNGATLAYTWGTIHTEPFEEARAAYHGVLGKNPVTERLEPRYPKWKRVLKFYGVSVPVVILSLYISLQVMYWYFHYEGVAMAYHAEIQSTMSSVLVFVPSTVYAVIITLMNAGYRPLAQALNDWENHRLQSAYDNHLVTKLVLFDFMNCFSSLFYIAFVQKDFQMLRTSLVTLLITMQIIQQCQEALLPYLLYKYRKRSIIKTHEKDTEDDTEGKVAEIEGCKDRYMGTLDDYLELSIQFGYVFLFSAVYPAAAFWALINNVMEIRSDAFKLCRVFQRPFAQPTAGIGAWQLVFEILGIMAVMTNCALIALSPSAKAVLPGRDPVDIIMLFVVAEHVILLVKLLLAYVIPDEPSWVHNAIQRLEYQSKRAWRLQKYKSLKSVGQSQCDPQDEHISESPQD